jgi:hypothetical protein
LARGPPPLRLTVSVFLAIPQANEIRRAAEARPTEDEHPGIAPSERRRRESQELEMTTTHPSLTMALAHDRQREAQRDAARMPSRLEPTRLPAALLALTASLRLPLAGSIRRPRIAIVAR